MKTLSIDQYRNRCVNVKIEGPLSF